MLSALIQFFGWLLAYIQSATEGLFAYLWSAIPEGLGLDLGPFGAWVEAANHWLPIGEAAVILISVLTFKVVFITVKLTIKLIPTVG